MFQKGLVLISVFLLIGCNSGNGGAPILLSSNTSQDQGVELVNQFGQDMGGYEKVRSAVTRSGAGALTTGDAALDELYKDCVVSVVANANGVTSGVSDNGNGTCPVTHNHSVVYIEGNGTGNFSANISSSFEIVDADLLAQSPVSKVTCDGTIAGFGDVNGYEQAMQLHCKITSRDNGDYNYSSIVNIKGAQNSLTTTTQASIENQGNVVTMETRVSVNAGQVESTVIINDEVVSDMNFEWATALNSI